MSPLYLPAICDQLAPIMAKHPTPIYLVGGAVRDALLGLPVADLDYATAQNAIKLTFAVGDALDAPAYVLDRERDIGRVILPDGMILDFAKFRGETASLESDLKDRDFTLNALAVPADNLEESAIIDLVDGRADITKKIIRQTNPHALTNDPVRAIRMVRMAVKFGFRIDPTTLAHAETAGSMLNTISAERIRDELVKMLTPNHGTESLRLMRETHLLPLVLPELAKCDGVIQSPPHREDVFAHTISVVDWVDRLVGELVGSSDCYIENLEPHREKLKAHLEREIDGGMFGWQTLMWAAVFHDTGKPKTRTVEDDGRIRFLGHEQISADFAEAQLTNLRFSNEAVKATKAIVAGHMRVFSLTQHVPPSKRSIYRYFKRTAEQGIDIILHALADHLAKYDGMGEEAEWQALKTVVSALLDAYFAAEPTVVKPPRLIDGNQLMEELNIRPGKIVGDILAAIEEAQAVGEVDSQDSALEYAKQWLAQN